MSTWVKQADDWTAALAAAAKIPATRDPDLLHPPVLFVSTPEFVTAPISAPIMEFPVHVIAPGNGKQQLDALLDMLPAVLDATGQQTAALTSITIGDIPFNAYLVTVPVRFDPPTP